MPDTQQTFLYPTTCITCHGRSNEGYTVEQGGFICESCYPRRPHCYNCDATLSAWTIVLGPDDVIRCGRCHDERFLYCDRCDEMVEHEDAITAPNTTLCYSCYEYFISCDGCGRAYHEEEIHNTICEDDDTGFYYCNRCARERGISTGRNPNLPREWPTLLRGTPRETNHFGVEVEAEWGRRNRPFRIGGYHSAFPADPSWFSAGWRAERDGSLWNGAELISPPVNGAPGLAEVVDNINAIRELGGRVPSSTGQHITVEVPSGMQAVIRAQFLAAILEDAMFALTGNYQRWNSNHYCRRLKTFPMSVFDEREGVHARTSVAHIKSPSMIEFRYPAGTLQPTQVAINVGLTQLVSQMAASMTWDETLDMFAGVRQILMGGNSRSGKLHESVKYGMAILEERGWYEGGPMEGLPYDPQARPVYTYSARGNRPERTVLLPSGRSIISRMKTAVNNFYDRMANDALMYPGNHVTYEEWKGEVREIFAPAYTLEEALASA